MGLFSFIKNAGAKLFGKADEAAAAPEEVSQEVLDGIKADELLNAINNHGLKIDSLFVAVEGDLATISGSADNQGEREKAILVAGNVHGIAQVDDQLTVEVEEPEAKFHTVVSGDTLGKIAKTYYGNAMKYPEIYIANKPMLTDPDKIYVGQVLRIPNLA
ncbi:UNVERIFIED_CONTAM: hypothetical protein GTU68_041979 [Idotea baltica]|nr:hypothetical protein [Idotea baltica]